MIITIFFSFIILNFCTKNVYSDDENDYEQLKEGVYIIKSAINENYVLDIYNNSKENGANLELWTNNHQTNQKFKIKKLENGYYSILPVHSNKCIDVEANSKKTGANVLQWANNNQDNQQWLIKDLGNGYCNIISKSNGGYLDIPYSDAKNGANLQVWINNGGLNQMFKFDKQNEKQTENLSETESNIIPKGEKTLDDGIYTIKTILNENLVFDIYNNSRENGANVELWSNYLSDNQRFNINYLEDGYYSICPLHSSKSIDVEGNSKELGANIIQWKINHQDNQKWIIRDVGNGYYNIISKSNGLYIDIPYSKAQNGSNVQMWIGNNGKNQMFKFEKQVIATGGEKTVEDGLYTLVPASFNDSVIDIASATKNNGGKTVVWKNNLGANQKFIVNYLDEGYYSIGASHSGKFLDVEGASNKSGTNVIQWEGNNQDNQKWIIKDVGDGYYNIISKFSGLYLTVSPSIGNVYISKEENSSNQKFKFEVPVPIKGNQTIADGTYIIASALNTGYVLDIPNNSKNNEEVLEIWKNNISTNQKFSVTYIGNGYYTISAQHSEKAIEVANGKIQFNARVQQNTVDLSDKQKWIIKDAGNGFFHIISKCNELYMGVTVGNAQNGAVIEVSNLNDSNSQKFKFIDPNSLIKTSIGTYGISGLKVKGDGRGRNLEYYQYGSGSNVLFATFSVHGFEDKWYQDGTELYHIANGFWDYLKASKDLDLANKWTIYIFPEVNPDGRRYGWSKDGPGRTTLYSAAPSNQGIDLNRCWSSDWIYQSANRNYTGTEPFQAYEAKYLREFLLQHKSQNGQTLLVDLHGWTQQLIGDPDIRSYYRKYFSENTDTPTYGKGYLINWARNNLGSNNRTAKSALIELPSYIQSSQDVITYGLKDKYINATLSMLRGIN